MRTLREHNPEEYERRFWNKVAVGGPDDCWEWTGSVRTRINKDGKSYGRIRSGDRTLHAHRESYRLRWGDPPDDKLVLHTCDNPACVNPNHLYLGTPADNVRDMYERKRARHERGTDRYNAKLNPDKVREIRRLRAEGMYTTDIAKKFGINGGTVSRIIRRLRWAHVD